MDFLKDLENIILKKLDEKGIRANYNDVHELLRKFLNIKNKLVEIKPRKVIYSTELKSKMSGESYFDVLKIVEEKFKNGEDITPHLSKLVIDPENQDGLLNDWAIHHLHLSKTKKKPHDKFYVRSDYLLMFILVDPDLVCFLDVRPHSESHFNNPEYPLWVRDELLEIIQKNWPELLEEYEYKGFNPAEKYTKKKYKQLRDAGIFMDVIIGDKVYAPPGGGVTTARTGAIQTSHADAILNKICTEYKGIKNDPDSIKDIMKGKGITPPSELEFTLIDDPNHGLVCLEKKTNWGYTLNIKLDLQ